MTIRHQETDAIHQTPFSSTHNGGKTSEHRESVCEIFWNGWRSSQTIQRTQKCLCPHALLRTQIWNVLQEWDPGSTVFFNHFPKDRNREVCLRTKMTRAPCRRRTGAAVPRAEKFGDLITGDHKVLSEGCESRNNHRLAIWYKILPLNGFNPIRAKQKLLRRRRKGCKNSRCRRTDRKLMGMPVKVDHGIIELQHLVNLRRMVPLNEQCKE